MEVSLTSHADSWIPGDGVIAVVRLGDRRGTWHVPPDFASARHVLLHTTKSAPQFDFIAALVSPLTPASRELQTLVGLELCIELWPTTRDLHVETMQVDRKELGIEDIDETIDGRVQAFGIELFREVSND